MYITVYYLVGVLDVLHCVLIDSPEALNVIKEQHIRTIISLIDKHGRDPKVCSLSFLLMQLLCDLYIHVKQGGK